MLDDIISKYMILLLDTVIVLYYCTLYCTDLQYIYYMVPV